MYRCNYCPKSYVWEEGLRRHIKTKHIDSQQVKPNNVNHTDHFDTQHDLQPMDCNGQRQCLQISRKPITFQHPFTMTMSGPTGSGKPCY